MMQLKISQCDSLRAITAAPGPLGPGDVPADESSQVGEGESGGRSVKAVAFVGSEATEVIEIQEYKVM